jgi:hypothetical protein
VRLVFFALIAHANINLAIVSSPIGIADRYGWLDRMGTRRFNADVFLESAR